MEAHKRSLFSEAENGWSRRQNQCRERCTENHKIVGSAAAADSISSANNPLETTRLFVVSKPFSAILFIRGVWPRFMAQVQEEILVEKVGTGIASTQKYD
ncbi:MAG TPA: hypothetical protein VN825_04875, partial [Candidatus Acidoferrum sp.]|nr:hypothetical protein [Candidatus Acidoferrum sp.]